MTNQFRHLFLVASAVLAFTNYGQATPIVYLRDAPGGVDRSGNPTGVFLAGAVLNGAGNINSWSGGAGTLDFEIAGAPDAPNFFSLLTYCGDPYRSLSVGPANGLGGRFGWITLEDFGHSTRTIDAIEILWANAFTDSKTSSVKAAAFQFLIWEYIADTTFNLTLGNVTISNQSVFDQAMSWSNNLATWTSRANLIVLDGRDENKQSFFIEEVARQVPETATPEPGTMALLGAGLLALGYFRRK